MKRRAVLIPLVVLLVVTACTAVYFVLSGPAYRTVVLVDTSAPGTGLSELGGAVRSVAGNGGDSDALSVRRFGGECGSPDATAEIADGPDGVAQAVSGLAPSGKATMVDGVKAAIDDFSGLLTRRGSVRNRIIVVSSSGVDACTNDPDSARKSIEDRMAQAGLDLDIRVVGFQVPKDQREALTKFASDTTFADSEDDLVVVLDRLVIPNSPDAATLSVAAKPEPSYAFLTANRLAVVRGTEVVAETAVGRAYGYVLRYTADGRFVLVTTDAGIVTLDVRSGAAGLVPCGNCTNAVPVGDSVIRWLAGNVVTTLDLADENARPVQGPTVLPDRQVDGFNLPLRMLAGREGYSLVAAPGGVSAYGGPEALYLVRPDGQVGSLGTARGNVAVYRSAFSPDGRFLAYAPAAHNGFCEELSSVVLINLDTGAQSGTPVVGDPSDNGSSVSDVWYDEDGTLNMVYSSRSCAASGGPRTTVNIPESHWRLGNSGWGRQDGADYSREVAPGFRVAFVLPDPDGFSRQLFSEVNGTRTKIADDAFAIAVPN
ncbi:hypothetical protein [Lentzea sp. CA-135723]|uniref:hypothetical protein n=1 Tax=Lentzea sp. CA-135723 TaxID=3239950 RepID=UPI003D8FCCF6